MKLNTQVDAIEEKCSAHGSQLLLSFFLELFPNVKIFCPDNISNITEGIAMKLFTLIDDIEVKCSAKSS